MGSEHLVPGLPENSIEKGLFHEAPLNKNRPQHTQERGVAGDVFIVRLVLDSLIFYSSIMARRISSANSSCSSGSGWLMWLARSDVVSTPALPMACQRA